MKVSDTVRPSQAKVPSTRRRKTKASQKVRPWKSILVPTDFSPASFKALEYAYALTELSGAKLTLVHIVVPVAAPDLVYGPVDWDESVAIKMAKERLGEIRQERGYQSAVKFRTIVRRGHPYQEIDRVARELQADLIVVATHGRTGLQHLLLGSVAEHVVRHAPCPVLVVRENERDFVR